MEYVLCIGLGFWIGYKIAEAITFYALKKMLDELGITRTQLDQLATRLGITVPSNSEDSSADSELPIVPIKIEQQGDMMYVFRKDTDQFLGQAATQEELILRLGEKMRNVKLTVAREDGGELMGGRSWVFDTDKKEIKKAD